MKRWIGRALGLPIAFLFLYCLLALIGALIPAGSQATITPISKAPVNKSRPNAVQLVSGPIHYDFLIPLDAQVRARFQFLEEAGLPIADPRSRWLVIGWGARSFYTTTGGYQDVTLKAVIKGAAGDHSVLRVDVLGALPNLPDLPKVRFDADEYDAFLEALTQSFERDEAQGVLRLPLPGFTQRDAFFAAKGRFHLFQTCNTWVARMIHASGRRFGIWTPLPYSIRLSHALYLDS